MIFKKYKNRFGHEFILEEDTLRCFLAMQGALDTEGIDIEMAQGWRGEKEQNDAQANGLSKAKWGSSPHNYGVAFDICCARKGEKLGWPKDDALWNEIGRNGKALGLVWGGDFKSIHDPDHFEMGSFEKLKPTLTLYPEAPPYSA